MAALRAPELAVLVALSGLSPCQVEEGQEQRLTDAPQTATELDESQRDREQKAYWNCFDEARKREALEQDIEPWRVTLTEWTAKLCWDQSREPKSDLDLRHG